MKQQSSWPILGVIAGMVLSVAVAVIYERYGAIIFGSASPSERHEVSEAKLENHLLALPGEFTRWIYWPLPRGKIVPEPIMLPAMIREAIDACAGTEPSFSRCLKEKQALLASVSVQRATQESMQHIARCLTTTCEGAMKKAPANACFWWSYYSARYERHTITSADHAMHAESCSAAQFGSEKRREAMLELWVNQFINAY